MKPYLLCCLMMGCLSTAAQTSQKAYPIPEFINEVYLLQKDSNRVLRLEKNSATMQTKMKLGGFGGAEAGYFIDEEKSTVRLPNGATPSFVYYLSDAGSSDSATRKNTGYPSGYGSMGLNTLDELKLQRFSTSKGKRKLLLTTMQGSGNQKQYSFGIKKIREGYYELVLDKALPKGEYAFVTRSMMSADGAVTLFCFAVD
jgi:hypothetical protein